MIPDHRLAELLDQVKQNQINSCLYHNTAVSPSLYADHECDREDFPLRTMIELDQHKAEVWHVQFSHDGTKLATAGAEHHVFIYDTNTFTTIHKLNEHSDGVVHVCWSPDDTKIITSSLDSKAKVWDTSVRLSHLATSLTYTAAEREMYHDCRSSYSPPSNICIMGSRLAILHYIFHAQGDCYLPLER